MNAPGPYNGKGDIFKDIRIIDLDLKKTTWSRVHDAMRVMFLRLDREPEDLRWVRLFHEERQSRVGVRRRGLWLEGEYISFDCLPAEVEEFHLPDIRKSIDHANREFRKLLEQELLKRRATREDTLAETEALQELQARIRALVGSSDGSVEPAPEPPAPPAPGTIRVDNSTDFDPDLRAEMQAQPALRAPGEFPAPPAVETESLAAANECLASDDTADSAATAEVAMESPAPSLAALQNAEAAAAEIAPVLDERALPTESASILDVDEPPVEIAALTGAAPEAADEDFENLRLSLRERFRAALLALNQELKRGQR